MSQDIRRELISKNLGIKPINHGQVYAFQIAIPDSRKQPISLEHRQAIEKSLLAHQSNLISLIIRRTNNYDDEDIEYELVYGADWLQIAQELEIEKVWAWVFDMTDEQAIAAIAEMESLTEVSTDTQIPRKAPDHIDSDLAALIDKKLQLATDSIKNSITPLLTGIRDDLDEKLKVLNYRINSDIVALIDKKLQLATDSIKSSITPLLTGVRNDLDEKLKVLKSRIDNLNSTNNNLNRLVEKLDTIQQQLNLEITSIPPVNLLTASDQEIKVALEQLNTRDVDIKAAIEAIRYWRQSKQGLTWKNLKISAKAKRNSQDKINGFAEKTYERLRAVANISEGDNAESL